VHLLPKDLRFEQRNAKPASCPGRHLTSLRPCCYGSSRKIRASLAQQCFFFIHASFHTTQYKTTKFTTISSHCLAAFSTKVSAFSTHMRQNAYDRNGTFEDLLLCYCYAIKSNDRTIRSQALQPASAGKSANMSKLQAQHFMTPEERTYVLCSVSFKPINCYCMN